MNANLFHSSSVANNFISEYVAQRDAAALEQSEDHLSTHTTDLRDIPNTSTQNHAPSIETSAPHVAKAPIAVPDLENKADSKAKADLDRAELKLRFLEAFGM